MRIASAVFQAATAAFMITVAASCSCERGTKNIVADQETHKVLAGVQVLSVAATNGRQTEEQYTYTDSGGYFAAGFKKGGVAKCPVLKLTLTKFDYVTVRVADPQLGDTIFMKRISP